MCSCLGVFASVLEFVFGGDQPTPAAAVALTKYKIAFQTIASDVLRKIEFRTNQVELELLDDDSLDDNNRTEWQGVLVECVDLLVKVAVRSPAEMLTQIAKHIGECSSTFFALESSIVVSPSSSSTSSTVTKRLVVTDEAFSNQLHCALRDLTLLLQLLGALVEPVLCNSNESAFIEYAPFSEELLGRVMQIVRFRSVNRLFALSLPSDSDVSREDFVRLHAQAILTLGQFSRWLSLYSARRCDSSTASASNAFNSQQTPELLAASPQPAARPGALSPSAAVASANKFHILINSIVVDCCVPVISPQTHSSILISKFVVFWF